MHYQLMVRLPPRGEIRQRLYLLSTSTDAVITDRLAPLIADEAGSLMTPDEFVAMLVDRFRALDTEAEPNISPALLAMMRTFIDTLVDQPLAAEAAKASWVKLQANFLATNRTAWAERLRRQQEVNYDRIGHITLPSREEILRRLNMMPMGSNPLVAGNLFPLIAAEADRTMAPDEFVAMLMEKFTEFDAQTGVNLKPALQCLIDRFIDVLIDVPNAAKAAKVSWRKLQDPFPAFTRTITMIWGGDGKN